MASHPLRATVAHNATMRLSTVMAAIILSCASATAQRQVVCPQEYLDLHALNEIGRATSCQSIDRAFDRILAPDSVTKLVYAAHRARRCPGTESDNLLIKSLPSDAITFKLIYSLTYPSNDVTVERAVDDLASGLWLDLALNAVIRQGHGGRAFLMQSFLGNNNADIGEMFDDLHTEFRRRAPKNFAAAVKSLPQPAREFVDVER